MATDYPPTPPSPSPLGGLPSVSALVEIAQSAKIPPDLTPLLIALLSFARTQHEINRRVFERIGGSLPTRHALTHKGGSDSVIGTMQPTAITALTMTGGTGAAQLGASAVNHTHEVDLEDDVILLAILFG